MNTDHYWIGNYCSQHLAHFYFVSDNLVDIQISCDSLPVTNFHNRFFQVRRYRYTR